MSHGDWEVEFEEGIDRRGEFLTTDGHGESRMRRDEKG